MMETGALHPTDVARGRERWTRRTRAVGAVALVAVLAPLAACGSSEGATASAPSTTSTTVAAGTEVRVGLADYSITVPGKLDAGPTQFVAKNTGKVEHQMTIVRLRDGEALPDLIGALTKDPAKAVEAADLYVGPQSVAPGATQRVAVDLPAGDYVALCVIPAEDGMPHAAKGMLASFQVTGTRPKASAVPAGPTIALQQYRFTVPKGFDGQGRFRVENRGTLPHELAIYRVPDGRTYAEAKAFITGMGPTGGIDPADPSTVPVPMGGTTAISKGAVGAIDLDLSPGTYVFVCFLPGTDGKAHFQHGMVRRVVVH